MSEGSVERRLEKVESWIRRNTKLGFADDQELLVPPSAERRIQELEVKVKELDEWSEDLLDDDGRVKCENGPMHTHGAYSRKGHVHVAGAIWTFLLIVWTCWLLWDHRPIFWPENGWGVAVGPSRTEIMESRIDSLKAGLDELDMRVFGSSRPLLTTQSRIDALEYRIAAIEDRTKDFRTSGTVRLIDASARP